MIKKNSLFIILILIGVTSFAGLFQFQGFYQGKNLFLENDFINDANHHCITNVYVNSKHLAEHPAENIVEVNLSMFKIGDTLNIRIYHKEGCTPNIINKHDVEPKANHFAFIKVTTGVDMVHWETKGEDPVGKFSLEQEVNGFWKVIQNVKAQGTASANSYNIPCVNLAGNNKYRVKYRSAGGGVFYSEEVTFFSNKSNVVFYPKRVVDFITFESDDHRQVEYTILDDNANLLFEGKGLLVDCRNLPSGYYYIIRYENKEERFYKKDGQQEVNTNLGKK